MLTHPSSIPFGSASKIALSAILYDLDGTLVNTDPIHFRAWQEKLSDYGMTIDQAFYQKHISGRLNPAIVADLLPHLSETEANSFIEAKEARFRHLTPNLERMAGLTQLLEWARDRQLHQAVVTNAPPKNVHHTLQSLKLQEWFQPVVIADELGIGKPDPAPYRFALEQLKLKADRAIAFEDSPSGIRSATRAGIFTIGVASTHDPQVLSEVGAQLVIDDFNTPALWELLSL